MKPYNDIPDISMLDAEVLVDVRSVMNDDYSSIPRDVIYLL